MSLKKILIGFLLLKYGDKKGEFMQEANSKVNDNLTERGNIVKRKHRMSGNKTRGFGKRALALALTLISLSVSASFSALASPEQEDILVFSEEGAIISQEATAASLFSEDLLVGDTVSKSQQIVD